MQRKKDNKKVNFEISKGLALISQLAISFLLPVFFSIWASKRLVARWNLSNGYILLALLLGVAIGCSSVYHVIASAYGFGKKKKNILERASFGDLSGKISPSGSSPKKTQDPPENTSAFEKKLNSSDRKDSADDSKK